MGGEAPQPGRLSRALSLDGSGVPEEALHLVLGYVDDPRDREAASLACRRWHRIDALTRKHVTVHFCYAVSPSRLLARFPRLESHGARTRSKRGRTSSSAVDTPQKLAKASLFADQAATTPEKVSAQKPGPLSPSAAATGLTWTPEKTEERRRPLLRRASGKGAVALSVKEVRRAALELQRTDKGHTAEVEKEDALESVARELGVGAGAGRSPVKRRPEVKLPQRTRPFHYLLMHGDKDAAGRLLSCWSASLPARHSRPEVLRLMS